MKANPNKFQAIAIGPKTNKHNLSFDLKGNKKIYSDLLSLSFWKTSLLSLCYHFLEF
jgi:hypothetical protein